VVERSDVVVQIVDARVPLMFRCRDLESYVKEVSPNKLNTILVNKSDFLTESQRRKWAEYFTEEGMKVLFFSATAEATGIFELIQDGTRRSEGLVKGSIYLYFKCLL